MLIDTHCHLNMIIRSYKAKQKFEPLSLTEQEACKKIIDEAISKGVTKIINVGTDLIESLTSIDIAKQFDNCYATIGLHPTDTAYEYQPTITELKLLLDDKQQLKIVGIGECGIDKFHPGYNLDNQRKAFAAQIELALEHNLPLVVHSRNADQETYESIAAYKGEPNLKGTIHCFSSNEEYAQKYLDLGFVLGFGGTVTYPKNETLRNVVKMIPLEKIILETDAPFLPPQVIRGKQNTPAQIRTIAEYIAELRSENYNELAKKISETTTQLFGL